jgi:hypothetical protein
LFLQLHIIYYIHVSTIVGDWKVRMFDHIGLEATTTEIPSYMIWQSYWKMYHWQSQHECGTCVMVLRAVTPVMPNGQVEEDPLHGLHAPRTDLNPLDFYLWEHLNTLVYAAPVDNGETLHHRTVDACQTILNFPGIFALMWRSMVRSVEACIETQAGHYEHLF